ncbi:MAG: hypothetical protein NVSMB42_14120 [Herpetosiphon sp.]
MNHRISRLWLVLGLLSVLAVSSAASLSAASLSPARSTVRFQEGTLLVGFQPGTDAQTEGDIESNEGAVLDNVIGAGTHLLRVPAGQVAAKAAALKRHAEVAYAEPNYIWTVDLAPVIPNDPSFGDLWGLRNTGQIVSGSIGTPGADIQATDAWAITTGNKSIVVGVVDTGIDYNHPDLAANVWSNPGGIGGCALGTHGYNAITRSCDPLDDNNHGTHVSGTIGAVGNNAIGVVGVNWNVSIMGLKFLDAAGSGNTADAITAIDFAVKAKIAGVNVRALNNSWGGGPFSQALLDEINIANANDILFVAAAGNSSTNNDITPHYPSNYNAPNIISVAATDQTDALAYFSSYGATTVHLGAPGVNILSTTPNNTYSIFNGTSMATPHVTGAAALILSQTPQTTAQLKSTILSSVDPDPALAGLTITGGRLNVCRALPGCAARIAPPPPPPPTPGPPPTPTTPTDGNN